MAGTLRLVLGDQLTRGLTALDGAVPGADEVVLMAEVAEEATHVPSSRVRIALFLSAMRHFAGDLAAEGLAVDYVALDDPANTGSLAGELARAIARHAPRRVVMTEAGDWRVEQALIRAAAGVDLDIRPDTRFLCSRNDFRDWAGGRRQLRMEHFYRMMRRRTGLLMAEDGDSPAGDRWNFDAENRKPFDATAAGGRPPAPAGFPPDDVTRAVIGLVDARFGAHVGDTAGFDWPVTRADALMALEDFITRRLARFGDYQDAMAAGEEVLFHARISPALNLGLLEPLEVCRRAETAWAEGRAPLAAVEGFIRQILGWREYVRGIYWLEMPGYAATNALDAHRPLPWMYWSGETDMACMAAALSQTLRTGYAHHIQRLMVTGNFALLTGARPGEVAAWYLAVYADAVDWVELPNVQGMALHADGGRMASKPYAAGAGYISRMSDHCSGCRYDPKRPTGDGACPFNALYWDFLIRNRRVLGGNPRLALAYRSLDRMAPARVAALGRQAADFLAHLDRHGSDRGFGRPTGAPTDTTGDLFA
jgi:deoxyribodipyrimidine photolyase-related protein